ncbi:hypothetical protein RJG79_03050 [Mycoplasmatota bacterium WC44]
MENKDFENNDSIMLKIFAILTAIFVPIILLTTNVFILGWGYYSPFLETVGISINLLTFVIFILTIIIYFTFRKKSHLSTTKTFLFIAAKANLIFTLVLMISVGLCFSVFLFSY